MEGYRLLSNKIIAPKDVVDYIMFLVSEDVCLIIGEFVVVDNRFELNYNFSFK